MENYYSGKICTACMNPIAEGEQAVFCGSCGKPYHLACWQSNGGCIAPDCPSKAVPDAPTAPEPPAVPEVPAAPEATVYQAPVQQAPYGYQPQQVPYGYQQPPQQAVPGYQPQPGQQPYYPDPRMVQPQYQQAEAAQPPTEGEKPKKKKGKGLLIAGIITAVVLAGAACFMYFFGIPFIKYAKAGKMLESGEYDAAHDAYEALGGFLDSETKADSALFSKASAYLENKEYDKAIEVFNGLGSFENSAEMVNKAKYEKAKAMLEDKQYDEAIAAFEELGDYGTAAEMVLESKYQKAGALLEDGQFDEASALYEELGDYDNSSEMVKETKYRKALSMLENGKFDKAIQGFRELGDYKDSETMLKESKYQKALNNEEKKDYETAYKLFKELGSYKESEKGVLRIILLWEAVALGSDSTAQADKYVNTVTLGQSSYEYYYSTIMIYLQGHPDCEYWLDWWEPTVYSKNVKKMLTLLPTGYSDTSKLVRLFDMINGEDVYYELFVTNPAFAEQCWSLAIVQSMAASDAGITFFLRGYWTGSGYYLRFYEDDPEQPYGTYSQFDLPWVAKPKGTRYYDIEDLVYFWEDENYNRLANVFEFEIVDYNTIRVYCYKDGNTYTMRR